MLKVLRLMRLLKLFKLLERLNELAEDHLGLNMSMAAIFKVVLTRFSTLSYGTEKAAHSRRCHHEHHSLNITHTAGCPLTPLCHHCLACGSCSALCST